jgi:uncharacterized protein YceK
MKRILKLLMLGCLFTTGCGTVSRFTGEAGNNYTLYQATRTDLDSIHNCLQPPPHVNCGLVPGWMIVPFPIIDLPFAIFLDTVLLPYDACRYRQARKAGLEQAKAYRFWGEAFRTDTITAEEASRYFSGGTQDQIFLELRDGEVKPNVLTVVFDLSMAQNKTNLLVALSAYGGLSQDQCRALYAWQLAGGDSKIQYNLARNPATPLDMLTLFAASPDELLCRAVAEGGHLPWTKLRETLAESKPEWHRQSLRLAADPATAPDLLLALARSKFYDGGSIQAAVAANRSTPKEGLQSLAGSPFVEVRAAVAANPATPEEIVRSLSIDKETDDRQ